MTVKGFGFELRKVYLLPKTSATLSLPFDHQLRCCAVKI